MENVLETLQTIELNYYEITVIHTAILSRINIVEKLIKSWEDYRTDNSDLLIETYNQDLKLLKVLERKFINL
jgi:hypothetical protein